MNWKLFLEGAAAAAIGGAVNHLVLIPDGATHEEAMKGLAIGALIGLIAYLKTNARQAKADQPPASRLRQSDPPPDPGPQG